MKIRITVFTATQKFKNLATNVQYLDVTIKYAHTAMH